MDRQFLARYIARRFAHFEDMFGFLADGSGTYASRNGVGAFASAQNPIAVVQLTSTKTKPSDAALADWRNMRALVNAAAIATGAYYCHPSMEGATGAQARKGDNGVWFGLEEGLKGREVLREARAPNGRDGGESGEGLEGGPGGGY